MDAEHAKLLHSINRELGRLAGAFEGLERHVAAQNGNVAKNAKRLGQHDVLLGKIGLGISAFVFIMTAVSQVVVEGVKKIFFN